MKIIKRDQEKRKNGKKLLKKIKKQAQGITLIALVVTVIVLLILAGVAINLTVGDNGLFKRAQNAVDTWQMAEQNEKKEIDVAEEQIDKYMPKVVDGVTIPYGFYYVGGAKDTGLIISDNISDENKYSLANWTDQENIPSGLETEAGTNDLIDPILGNQFVWVPVEADKFERYEGYHDGNIDSYIDKCSEPFSEAINWELTEYNLMKSSVIKNEGFYVARFEASEGFKKTAESKPGVEPWRYIAWGDSMTEIGTDGAVAKANNMYSNEEFAVTSTLIYGVQWDAIMTWIDPTYANEDGTCSSFVSNSARKGNYYETENTNEWKGKIAICGVSDNYRVKNIYDLAGNVAEWTMEAYSDNSRVRRGGNYLSSGYGGPASFRFSHDPSSKEYGYIGFRVALYIQKIYVDKNGDIATIPAGFAVSQVKGESEIDTGLVIIDSQENEFVWVPVNSETDFISVEGYDSGIQQQYLPAAGEADSTGTNIKYTEATSTQIEAKEMYASVKKYKGFYIGRYEAGKNSDGSVGVKKGLYAYRSTPWSANGEMHETEGTTIGAVELARNFDTINQYSSVTSTLIYGVQWDTTIKWIKNISNPDIEGKTYIQDSRGMGWYSDN